MTLIELMRALVIRGVALAVVENRVKVRSLRGSITPELRRAIGEHRHALVRLLAEPALLTRWQVPAEVSMPPALAGVLALLHLEFATFTAAERRQWLACLSRRNDAYYANVETGCPLYINHLFAVEDVLRERPPAVPNCELPAAEDIELALAVGSTPADIWEPA